MDFATFLSRYSIESAIWIVLGALLNWATLNVNPTGEVVPEHIARSIKIAMPKYYHSGLHQSPEQKARWEKLVGHFYQRMIDLSDNSGQTFSEANLLAIRNYLSNLASYDEVVQTKLFPENKVVDIQNPRFVEEDKHAQSLTEYMLHLNEQEALRLLENIVTAWASRLGEDDIRLLHSGLRLRNNNDLRYDWTETAVRGYVLYLIAEGLEH